MKTGRRYWIYLLRLENGRLYTGYTSDLERRYRLHLSGKGGRYTHSFRPVALARCWSLRGSQGQALSLEAFIKSRSRPVKDLLVLQPQALRGMYLRRFGKKLILTPWLKPLQY